jgi:hypothetical protein
MPHRQCKIWWHNRFDGPETEHLGIEIWWHCELSEFDFPGLRDYGQRKQAGAWSKTEVVYSGYDKVLSVAIRKALARAKKGIEHDTR